MKIGIVINKSWNIYNFRKGLVKKLITEGYEVIAIAPKDKYSQKLKDLGCKYEEVKMSNKGYNPFKDIQLIFHFYRIYKRIKPDILFNYTIKINIFSTIAGSLLKIPCINNVSGLGPVFIYNNLISFIGKLLYKITFRFPSIVFFQNRDDKNLFLSQKLVSEKITDLLPGSGIDINYFSPQTFKRNKIFTFLMIARVLYTKGILEFIGAIRILRRKNIDVHCKLLGAIEEEKKLGASTKDIHKWQEAGLIEYMGIIDDVRTTIQQSDCVVLPSYREGTPRSLLEAIAMGKPIITTDVPGCREVIKDKYNGFLCKVRDTEDLAEKMINMSELIDEQLKKMGENSRELAVNVFDEKFIIEKYMEAMNKVISGKNFKT